MPDKGLVSSMYKEHLQQNNKMTIQLNNEQRIDPFAVKDIIGAIGKTWMGSVDWVIVIHYINVSFLILMGHRVGNLYSMVWEIKLFVLYFQLF